MESRQYLVAKVGNAIDAIDGYMRDDALALLLGTAAVESRWQWRQQLGSGPARGLWQMEPPTAIDIFENYLKYRPKLYLRLMETLGIHPDADYRLPGDEELDFYLTYQDTFAAAMARLHYRRVPERLPERGDIEGQARYWKKYYNTELGAGSEEKYIEAFQLVVEGGGDEG